MDYLDMIKLGVSRDHFYYRWTHFVLRYNKSPSYRHKAQSCQEMIHCSTAALWTQLKEDFHKGSLQEKNKTSRYHKHCYWIPPLSDETVIRSGLTHTQILSLWWHALFPSFTGFKRQMEFHIFRFQSDAGIISLIFYFQLSIPISPRSQSETKFGKFIKNKRLK